MNKNNPYIENSLNLKEAIQQNLAFPTKEMDLVIIGGGLAGCSAAFRASQNSLSTCLLEKNKVGSGQSGNCGGQFIPGFEMDISSLIQKYGVDKAQTLYHNSQEALNTLREIMKEENVFNQSGLILSLNEEEDLYLKEELKNMQSIGIEVNYLSKPQLKNYINSNKYISGIFNPNTYHANPLKISQLLMKKAIENNVLCYENTEVQKIEKHGEKLLIKTNRGNIITNKVFLAGGESILLKYKFLSPTVWVKTWSIATEKLTKEEQLAILPNNSCCYDAQEATMDYFRIQDDRLLFGGGDSIAEKHLRGFSYLENRIVEIFPQLKNKKIEYVWSGDADVSSSRMPVFYNDDKIWLACGYSGHGTVNAFGAGQWAVDSMFGDSLQWNEIKKLSHIKFPANQKISHLSGALGAQIVKLFS